VFQRILMLVRVVAFENVLVLSNNGRVVNNTLCLTKSEYIPNNISCLVRSNYNPDNT